MLTKSNYNDYQTALKTILPQDPAYHSRFDSEWAAFEKRNLLGCLIALANLKRQCEEKGMIFEDHNVNTGLVGWALGLHSIDPIEFEIPGIIECPLCFSDNLGLITSPHHLPLLIDMMNASLKVDDALWQTAPRLWIGTPEDDIYDPAPKDTEIKIYLMASYRLNRSQAIIEQYKIPDYQLNTIVLNDPVVMMYFQRPDFMDCFQVDVSNIPPIGPLQCISDLASWVGINDAMEEDGIRPPQMPANPHPSKRVDAFLTNFRPMTDFTRGYILYYEQLYQMLVALTQNPDFILKHFEAIRFQNPTVLTELQNMCGALGWEATEIAEILAILQPNVLRAWQTQSMAEAMNAYVFGRIRHFNV